MAQSTLPSHRPRSVLLRAPGVLPADPTNHSTGLRWRPCLHEYLGRGRDHPTSERLVVPSHERTQSKSPSRSLPFIQAYAESITSPLRALQSSLTLVLSNSLKTN